MFTLAVYVLQENKTFRGRVFPRLIHLSICAIDSFLFWRKNFPEVDRREKHVRMLWFLPSCTSYTVMLWCLECRSVNERKWVLWKRDVPPWEESERNSENTASVCWTSTEKISSSKIQCQSQAPQFCYACTHKFTYNMTAGAAIEHDYTRVHR